MKFSSYILIPALTAMLSACSTADEPQWDGGNTATHKGGISYTVATALTRAAISGNTFPTSSTFCVYAFQEGESTPLIPGDIVRCLDGTVWATDDNYYWPESASVNFYAVYPASLSFDTSTRKVSYTVPTSVSQQEDVLYETVTASKTSTTVTGNAVKANAVPLTFHHALAQIAFKGKISDGNKDWRVDVTNIALCNVYSTATLDLTASVKTWTDLSTPASFECGIRSDAPTLAFYEDDGTTEAAATTLTATDGALLLLPQTLTPWPRLTVNATAAANTGCYLAVTCWIRTSLGDIRGTSEAPVTVYVPFDNGTGWEAGKRYVYTLNFGAGYDDEGKTILSAMTITSEVTDWSDGGSFTPNADMQVE